MKRRRGASGEGVDPGTLVQIQAALQAGASPSEALAACGDGGALRDVVREVRLGRPLAAVATEVATGVGPADLLVRALALAERTGAGAVQAVEQALDAMRADADLARLIEVRTAQARGTAGVLAGIPLVTWAVLVAADRDTLRFYATPLGLLTAGVAVVLAALSWRWMRRMAAACGAAADGADPLLAAPSPLRWRRAAAPAIAAGVVVAAGLGGAAGVIATLVVGAIRARPAPPSSDGDRSGAAEVIDLLAVAVTTGLPVPAALEEVCRVAPPRGAQALRPVTARLAAGWRMDEAFAGTPLAAIGEVLAAGLQWGAPVEPPLRRLADQLRAERRAAAEVAAERLQLALVFPTTLLTLPAFVLGVVPPLLWATLQR